MSDKPPSRTIFIGNIPYGLSEEQIIQLFSSAGQVISFRLVTDNDTGRPKGYGFAEFADADAAASAVRNLNNHTVMNRQLRVDFSHKDNSGGADQPAGGPLPPNPSTLGGLSQQSAAAGGAPINVSAVPPGVPLPPGVSCPDAISQTLARIPPAQLLDILSQFKGVVTTNPDSAAELLRQQPQLAYAIFQCLLTMGLVEAGVLKQVIEGAASGTLGGAAAPTPPVNTAQAFQPPPAPPPAPSVQPQAAQAPQQMPNLPPEQLQAIRSILAMGPEQYNALQPAERSQVDMLRAQYGSIGR